MSAVSLPLFSFGKERPGPLSSQAGAMAGKCPSPSYVNLSAFCPDAWDSLLNDIFPKLSDLCLGFLFWVRGSHAQ
jgi:hypothetical protein